MISRSFSGPKNPRSSQQKPTLRRRSDHHNGLVLAALPAQPLGFGARNLTKIFVVTGPFPATIFICGRATIFYAENRRRFAREICLVGAPYGHRDEPKVRCRPDR